eukprot:scaffold1220_cov376-Prasinococcus_capsulatus_cf.AAC.14
MSRLRTGNSSCAWERTKVELDPALKLEDPLCSPVAVLPAAHALGLPPKRLSAVPHWSRVHPGERR